MDLDDDEYDDESIRLYESGSWQWDEKTNSLQFQCAYDDREKHLKSTNYLDSVEFREDIDLNEQQRFRKRFQRKYNDQDVVTLEDVKDVVLFTAPLKILTSRIINLLHLRTTERFLRALLLFCHYYLQVTKTMQVRMLELNCKIRTLESDATEKIYQENLEDLRLLIAKEYSLLITGSGELAKYHHMGRLKKSRSMSKIESMQFETFIKICIQIIWVALGRRSYSEIELEVQRLFKSQIFNIAEHKLDKIMDTRKRKSSYEQNVMLGNCIDQRYKMNTQSPLMNEVQCVKSRRDYRLFGLGDIENPHLNKRLIYLEKALILPEKELFKHGISLGILGLSRSRFDILLKEILTASYDSKASVNKAHSGSSITPSVRKSLSRSSRASSRKVIFRPVPLKDICLPDKDHEENLLCDEFPIKNIKYTYDESRRYKWLNRIKRKYNKRSMNQSLQTCCT